MVKKDVYRFWAAFHYSPDGVSVRFPDLPGCFTSGDTAEEAHVAAREALGGFLCVMENDNDVIPDPSTLDRIIGQLEEGEAACDIQVYMPTVREAMESKAVKKTLTVPKWLADEGERHNLNFSQILQDGLKRSLGINAEK
ncbi:type II toxin-antitoxin system HicB family antitoxin [Paenibacillus koleovorans]|uniref:type II toxin-antitoxin system HicB family antitoxin n=1 Tax=Paenibacillus koleovorans TaxID=121608 RepID=UPI000FDB1538|nr:type II toxin-antitoxin system HicB family antitoxin [Paenibacillus koleovorans]